MYSIGNFDNLDSLCVICRGLSASSVKKYTDKFSHCFIVGQADNLLKKRGKHLKKKKKVLILNKCAITPNQKICKMNGIKDLQANFGKEIEKPLAPEKIALFRKIKRKNKWASVHLAPKGLIERRPVDYPRWCTTGLFGVDLACFYAPKKIVIFGLDFYHSRYFCEEKIKASIKSNKKRADEMLDNFYAILRRDSNVEFEIYTKCDKIKKFDNLTIHLV